MLKIYTDLSQNQIMYYYSTAQPWKLMSLSCQKCSFKISRVTIHFYGKEDN